MDAYANSVGQSKDVVKKTDQHNQCKPYEKIRVCSITPDKPGQCAQVKYNAPTPNSQLSMATPFILFVNDVIAIRNTEIHQHGAEKQNGNQGVKHGTKII